MAHSQQLFKKPKDMTYADMSIWLDKNFYEKDCDQDKAYSYLWLLSYMLACKHKYFNSEKDYEKFASFVAYDAYRRMTNTEKPLIKSGLNYIKSIMPFRKMAYESERRQEIIDSEFNKEWDGQEYNEQRRYSLEKANHEKIIDNVVDVISMTPYYIKSSIPRMFKKDKMYHNIYTSCLLSMINRMTLKRQFKECLDQKLEVVPNFNDVRYYIRHLDNDIILWHLPKYMENVVTITLNKVNNILVKEIKSLSDDIHLSDDEFSSIISSAFETGGINETNY